MTKLGRNELCYCDSGRKYKFCCMKTEADYSKLQQKISSFLLNLDPKQEETDRCINEIEELISRNTFSSHQKQIINCNILQIYIRGGYDNKALKILDSININTLEENQRIHILMNKLTCLQNIGKVKDACILAFELLEIVRGIKWGDKLTSTLKSGVMIEAAKTLQSVQTELGDNVFDDIILKTYDTLIDAYENEEYHDIDHYVGSISNKGFFLMMSNDEEKIKLGLAVLEKATEKKLQIGYWNGVSNDYCRLGIFYLNKKEYLQAIAYTKRDLAIVKEYGSKRDEISTMFNLVKIYRELRQFSEARHYLREIEAVSDQTQNLTMIEYCQKISKEINDEAKQLVRKGVTIGKKTLCACNSGKKYNECCGVADFNYKEIDKVIGLDSVIPYSRIVDNNKNILKKEDQLNIRKRQLLYTY